MNFGERIKQLRTERTMTQPQLAEAIGIEQSYLSKLENDKSVPSPDIFQAILHAFGLEVEALLAGVDDNIVRGDLKQIPEVAEYLKKSMMVKIHSVKRWLFTSAAACVIGLTLVVAGYRGLLISNLQHEYCSQGIVLTGEPPDIFRSYEWLLSQRIGAGEIDDDQYHKLQLAYANRINKQCILLNDYRGQLFVTPVSGGYRYYTNSGSSTFEKPGNRYLMLLGSLLAIGGVFGFFVEFRLRSVKM